MFRSRKNLVEGPPSVIHNARISDFFKDSDADVVISSCSFKNKRLSSFPSREVWLVQKGFFPLKSNKDAVLASCRFSGWAPIHIFGSKNLDDVYTYREIVRVNFRDSSKLHINASKLAIQIVRGLDQGRVLSVPNFRKCWIFWVENLKFKKVTSIS